VYGTDVAFWTSTFADVVPVAGVAARSTIWGFHPVYFNPEEVSAAMDIILFDEWQLSRNTWDLGLGVYGTPDGSEPVQDDEPFMLLSIYVVHSSATDVAGAEFAAPLPPCADGMIYLFDEPVWPATVGNSQTGVSVTYGGCLSSPVHVLTIKVIGRATTPECCYYPILPHPTSGQVRAMDCNGNWQIEATPPTFINGCPWWCGTPVEQSTWHKIKSLYE